MAKWHFTGWCASIRTHSGAKRLVRVDNLVDEDADNIVFTISLGIGGPTQQHVAFTLVKSSCEHGNQDKLEDLGLQLLGVIQVTVHLHEAEEDLPLLGDGVASGYVILQVGGEEVEGIDVAVKIHPQEVEEGVDVFGAVFTVD